MASDGVRVTCQTYVHAHLAWLGGYYVLSDMWGGVNGHGVNQCGVCDDVTGWMGRSSGRSRSE